MRITGDLEAHEIRSPNAIIGIVIQHTGFTRVAKAYILPAAIGRRRSKGDRGMQGIARRPFGYGRWRVDELQIDAKMPRRPDIHPDTGVIVLRSRIVVPYIAQVTAVWPDAATRSLTLDSIDVVGILRRRNNGRIGRHLAVVETRKISDRIGIVRRILVVQITHHGFVLHKFAGIDT